MARIRKGDVVAVMSGANKGKRGRVLRVLTDSDRVVIEGLNMVHKHLRKSQQNPQGGRTRREAPIHACTVMLIDPSTDKPTRVSSAVVDGRRVRVAGKSRSVIPTESVGKAAPGKVASGKAATGQAAPEGATKAAGPTKAASTKAAAAREKE